MYKIKTITIIVLAVFVTALLAAPASAYYRQYRPSRRGLRTWAMPTRYYGPPESIKCPTPTNVCAAQAKESGQCSGVSKCAAQCPKPTYKCQVQPKEAKPSYHVSKCVIEHPATTYTCELPAKERAPSGGVSRYVTQCPTTVHISTAEGKRPVRYYCSCRCETCLKRTACGYEPVRRCVCKLRRDLYKRVYRRTGYRRGMPGKM